MNYHDVCVLNFSISRFCIPLCGQFCWNKIPSRPSRLVTEKIVVETQAHAGRTKSKAQAVTAQSWFVFRKTVDDLNHSDSMELGK